MARKKAAKTHSMHPDLHESVCSLVEEHISLTFTFRHGDIDHKATNTWDTKVMGTFTYYNERCTNSGWSSKNIAIRIRMYPGGQYNARVYHQRCKNCKWVSEPNLDDSYAERIVY